MRWFWERPKEPQPPNPAPAKPPAATPPQQGEKDLTPVDTLAILALGAAKLESEGSAPEAEVARELFRDAARNGLKENVMGLTQIGRRLKTGGQLADAEVIYRFTVEIAGELGETNPFYGTALGNLGVFYEEQGRHAEAEPLYRRSLELLRKTPLGEQNPAYAHTLQRLGEICEATGRTAEARQCYQEVAALRRAGA